MVGAGHESESGSNGAEQEASRSSLGDWFRQHLLPALNGKPGNGKPQEGERPDAAPRGSTTRGISDSVSTVLGTKLTILREAVQEIESGLSAREKLNKLFEKQIDAEIEECADLLGKLPYPWSEGFQVQVEFLRSSLHKSLLTRRKDKRAEQLAYWDDVTRLVEKKRQVLMEYQSLLATRDSLGQTGEP